MEFIVDVLLNLLLLLGLFMFRWCKAHKQATLAILVVIMMIIDVLFILWRFGVLQL